MIASIEYIILLLLTGTVTGREGFIKFVIIQVNSRDVKLSCNAQDSLLINDGKITELVLRNLLDNFDHQHRQVSKTSICRIAV